MITKLLIYICGGFWQLYKKCNGTRFWPLKRFYRFIFRMDSLINGSSIAWNVHFAGEPCFPHGRVGIFISRFAQIGKNCVIFQHVTIGYNALPDSKRRGAPSIGENCYVGAGAKIIGNVQIGNNVRIGANCVVYKDVPDNSVVVSNVQKILKRSHTLCNRFYYNPGTWVYFNDGQWIEETDPTVLKTLSG